MPFHNKVKIIHLEKCGATVQFGEKETRTANYRLGAAFLEDRYFLFWSREFLFFRAGTISHLRFQYVGRIVGRRILAEIKHFTAFDPKADDFTDACLGSLSGLSGIFFWTFSRRK